MRKFWLTLLGLVLGVTAVATVVRVVDSRRAWGLLLVAAALGAGSWRSLLTAFRPPPPARAPWYR